MSEDLSTPGSPEDRHIEANQVDAWAISLHTTVERLCEAISKVGNKVTDVREHLKTTAYRGASGEGAASILPYLMKQSQIQGRTNDPQ
jgi:uncharacterized protein DUF3606